MPAEYQFKYPESRRLFEAVGSIHKDPAARTAEIKQIISSIVEQSNNNAELHTRVQEAYQTLLGRPSIEVAQHKEISGYSSARDLVNNYGPYDDAAEIIGDAFFDKALSYSLGSNTDRKSMIPKLLEHAAGFYLDTGVEARLSDMDLDKEKGGLRRFGKAANVAREAERMGHNRTAVQVIEWMRMKDPNLCEKVVYPNCSRQYGTHNSFRGASRNNLTLVEQLKRVAMNAWRGLNGLQKEPDVA
jgi:hypothetical protein